MARWRRKPGPGGVLEAVEPVPAAVGSRELPAVADAVQVPKPEPTVGGPMWSRHPITGEKVYVALCARSDDDYQRAREQAQADRYEL